MFIVIEHKDEFGMELREADVYPIDTPDELAAAREALHEAGLAEAPVYVGDPDSSNTYQNGQVVFAAESLWITVDDCKSPLTEALLAKIVRAPWGKQDGTHGRVFKRHFAPQCGAWRTRMEVLLDRHVVFSLEQGRDDVWRGEPVERARAVQRRIAKRMLNKAAADAYQEARRKAIEHLRGGGLLRWIPGQEGGCFEIEDAYVSARGALRGCGISAERFEAMAPRFDAKPFEFALLTPIVGANEVLARSAQLSVVIGDNGVGKTALLREIAKRTGGMYAVGSSRALDAANDVLCLCLDNPTRDLCPSRAEFVANAIRALAASGVRVVVATHDYLFARSLSIDAIYSVAPIVDTAFFALYHEDGEVRVELGACLSDLEHNEIVHGFQTHFDRETALFSGGAAS